jgi:hypothetical protein
LIAAEDVLGREKSLAALAANRCEGFVNHVLKLFISVLRIRFSIPPVAGNRAKNISGSARISGPGLR